jgi:hypothetical protein
MRKRPALARPATILEVFACTAARVPALAAMAKISLMIVPVNRCGIGMQVTYVRVFSLSRHGLDGLLILIVAVAGLYGAVRVGLQPRDPASGIGVIFAPWTSESSALERATAGARFVRFGAWPFIVVVVPDTPDDAARLSDAGAWLVVDPQVLAACFGAGPAS